MALVLKDRVKETTTTTGTGSYVLAGAATGFQSFTDALADGDTTYYAVEDGTNWETGLGTWTESTTTLARTTVYESSNSGNAVDWGSGSKNVFITQPATRVGTIPVYPTIDDLPMTGNQAGDQAYVSGNNRLYLFNGTGWYNIALINQTPTISGNSASYELATDGTATVVTLTGTDPEGVPITWSATTSGATSAATVTNVDNVFTITPSTDPANQGTITVTFRASDGVNIGTASSEFSLSFVSALWKDVALSIGTSGTNSLANNTFIDRSTNASTVTASGSPVQTAFHPYLDNWSVEFDADYLSVPHDSGFDFGTGDFTIELWYYPTATPGGSYDQSSLIGTYGNDGAAGWLCQYRNDGDFFRFANGNAAVLDVSHTLVLNQWVHLAWVRNSGTLTMYIDGVASGSVSSSTDLTYTSPLIIGRINHSIVTQYVIGNLSNFRVVKGAAVYTSDFTPATENLTAISGTSLLTCQSNRFIDNSTNDHTITPSGDAKISAFNPFGQESEYASGSNEGSVYFDTSSSVSIAHHSSQALGSNDFTIEWWMNPQTLAGTNVAVLDKGWGGNGYGEILIYTGTSGNYLAYSSSSGSLWNVLNTFNTGWVKWTNQWKHCAIVRNGTQIAFLLNGELTAAGTISAGTTLIDSGDPITLNAGNGNTNPHTPNYISDFKWVVGTAAYDATGASVGDQVFTPPTAPLGNTNADVYLPMDNAGIYDKTGTNTLTLVGDTSTSTTQTKYATTSMYFDGTDRFEISSGPFGFGTNDFTIEFWLNYKGNNGYVCFVNNDIGSGNYIYYGLNTGTKNPFIWNAGNVLTTSTAITNDVWQHHAVVRENGTVKIYLDGVVIGSTSWGVDLGSTRPLYFGTTNAGLQGTVGYVENVQILKGVAKYTANFTPPSQEQGRTYQKES